MVAERRRYIRFEIPLDVIFRASSDESRYSSGITKNFSRSGCCIETDDLDISLNSSLELQVKHPRRDIFVTATGDIVWKQHVGGKWLAGVVIHEMDKEAKSEILDFAYDIWLEKNMRTDAVQN